MPCHTSSDKKFEFVTITGGRYLVSFFIRCYLCIYPLQGFYLFICYIIGYNKLFITFLCFYNSCLPHVVPLEVQICGAIFVFLCSNLDGQLLSFVYNAVTGSMARSGKAEGPGSPGTVEHLISIRSSAPLLQPIHILPVGSDAQPGQWPIRDPSPPVQWEIQNQHPSCFWQSRLPSYVWLQLLSTLLIQNK